jgi:hypothetical protein
MGDFKSSNVWGDLKVTGNVGIGGAIPSTNYARVNIISDGTIKPLKFTSCPGVATNASNKTTMLGYLSVLISGGTLSGADGTTYYIPIYT